jgi:ferredoxin
MSEPSGTAAGLTTVVVNWDLCDGNAACVVEAPNVFDIDEDENLVVLQEQIPAEELAPVEAAVRACPKQALSLQRAV